MSQHWKNVRANTNNNSTSKSAYGFPKQNRFNHEKRPLYLSF